MAVEIPRDLADSEQGVTLRNGASVRVRAIRPDDEPRLMALCRRLSPRTTNEGTTADIGLVVADGWQGLGLGSLLLEEILRAGEQRGVHQFSADVLTENRRALRLLARYTAITRRAVASGVTSVVFSRRADSAFEATRHGGS